MYVSIVLCIHYLCVIRKNITATISKVRFCYPKSINVSVGLWIDHLRVIRKDITATLLKVNFRYSKNINVSVGACIRMWVWLISLLLNFIQTHKRFKITLFIRTKHNMRIFGIILFIKLQNDAEQLNGEKRWKMSCRANPFIFFWLSYV